ncbi:hypothetical protein BDN72DRAFT_906344 [Pluteus cervinus]|uniref:Uncharacterized protein n=1 Tax=Pluteus cervinus TaxID=181527 RepID=A0ACD3A1V6_9AGAR|nr:hypothetical protein BDN72DRAFT_906344 [Pluteus cervinus]
MSGWKDAVKRQSSERLLTPSSQEFAISHISVNTKQKGRTIKEEDADVEMVEQKEIIMVDDDDVDSDGSDSKSEHESDVSLPGSASARSSSHGTTSNHQTPGASGGEEDSD